MIIYWQTHIGGATRPHPHVYIGMGAIALRIGSPQALFVYTEISHLVTLHLNDTLIDLEV